MPNGLYILWAFSRLTYRLETNYHSRTQTQSSFIIALTSHLFWLGLHGRDFTVLQCWNHVLSLTANGLDGESVHRCVVHSKRQGGCLFFAVLSLVPLQVDCNVSFSVCMCRTATLQVSCSLGSHAWVLGSSFFPLGRGLEMPQFFFLLS